MNRETFRGFHGELNLESPGGWEYARMIQEMYGNAWKLVKKMTGIDLELDIKNRLLQPSLNFADLLVKASKKRFPGKEPFIVLVAEEGTLDDVVENSRFVDYLNSLDGVSSKLVDPRGLKLKNGKVEVVGREPTIIFVDFNNKKMVELADKKGDAYIKPLLKAIEMDVMVNPRGTGPVGAKGVFEAIIGEFKKEMSQSTVKRTPWTRKFFERTTTDFEGNQVDLVEWVQKPVNWSRVIFKPDDGYSGHGIIVCPREKDIKGGVKKALKAGNYIVQEFVPTGIWSEMLPEVDKKKKTLTLNERQTDFRSLISNNGVIGFLGRYGGIPTNVGSGGGVQALAIIKSKHSPGEAVKLLNKVIIGLGFDKAMEIRDCLDEQAQAMKFTYLLGPIPIALRPRVVSQEQIAELKEYAKNLYKDTLVLEEKWLAGKLDHLVKIDQREADIARMKPRTPETPAMIASDGLFDFGAGV